MSDKAVARKEETSVLMVDDEILANGTGLEDTSSEDFAIPFIRILQSGSPQVKKSEGKYTYNAPGSYNYKLKVTYAVDIVPTAGAKVYFEGYE